MSSTALTPLLQQSRLWKTRQQNLLLQKREHSSHSIIHGIWRAEITPLQRGSPASALTEATGMFVSNQARKQLWFSTKTAFVLPFFPLSPYQNRNFIAEYYSTIRNKVKQIYTSHVKWHTKPPRNHQQWTKGFFSDGNSQVYLKGQELQARESAPHIPVNTLPLNPTSTACFVSKLQLKMHS